MKIFLRLLACSVPLLASSSFGHGGRSHLWSTDARAYRSYRSRPPAHSPARRKPPSPFSRFMAGELVESLKILSGVYDPVLANRENLAGRAAARAYLRKEFEAAGFRVTEHVYHSGTNLVAERTGASGNFLIVSAHYDSVGNAGADDDASGVVAMLNAARALRDRDLRHGVRFVAFDEEEEGLVGSSAYVRALVKNGEKSLILGDLQMEMLGYNARKDGKFHVISCDRPDSQFMVKAFRKTVSESGSGLEITEACTDRSDHAAFWENGIPAIVISENFFGGDSNPCYHRACDRIEGMHLDYFTRVADVASRTVFDLVVRSD